MDALDGDTGLGGTTDEGVKALPLDDLEYPIAVTYDPVLKHVYWTDLTYGSITKAALDGSFKQTIVFDNNGRPIAFTFCFTFDFYFHVKHVADQIQTFLCNQIHFLC